MGYRVPGVQGVGLEGTKGSRGMPTGSQGVKGKDYRVPGDQGVCLQGLMRSRGRSTGSQGVSLTSKVSHRINSDN